MRGDTLKEEIPVALASQQTSLSLHVQRGEMRRETERKKGREVGTAERKVNEQAHDKCLIDADYYYCQAFNPSTPPWKGEVQFR